MQRAQRVTGNLPHAPDDMRYAMPTVRTACLARDDGHWGPSGAEPRAIAHSEPTDAMLS